MQIGSVEVTRGPDNLYVVYRTDPDRPMLATSLFVGSSASDIPTTWRGRPRLLRFPYKAAHRRVHEVVWEIPRSQLSGPDVVVALFALVLNGVMGLPRRAAGKDRCWKGENLPPKRARRRSARSKRYPTGRMTTPRARYGVVIV
jgi:hypothetical protein